MDEGRYGWGMESDGDNITNCHLFMLNSSIYTILILTFSSVSSTAFLYPSLVIHFYLFNLHLFLGSVYSVQTMTCVTYLIYKGISSLQLRYFILIL